MVMEVIFSDYTDSALHASLCLCDSHRCLKETVSRDFDPFWVKQLQQAKTVSRTLCLRQDIREKRVGIVVN